MAMIQKNQHATFEARLARIASAQSGPGGGATVTRPAEMKGRRGRRNAARLAKVEEWQPPKVLRKRRTPKMKALVLSLAVGALAVVAARYGRFRFDGSGLTGDSAAFAMAADVLVALAVGLFASTVLKLRGAVAKIGLVAGVAAGTMFMHDAVHYAPDRFAGLFSPEWVAEVTRDTVPNSALILGESYEIGKQFTSFRAAAADITDLVSLSN